MIMDSRLRVLPSMMFGKSLKEMIVHSYHVRDIERVHVSCWIMSGNLRLGCSGEAAATAPDPEALV